MRQLGRLSTEQVNPNSTDIDRLSAHEIVRKINDEDKTVATVVEQALPSIARAAEQFAETLKAGGRVLYIGAGTSGRLGVLDAAECPPTFGTDPEQIVGVISGGYATLVLSMEGVEDRRENAIIDLKQLNLSSSDFLIGLAASTRTPYTIAGLQYAQATGCKTAFIICNHAEDLEVSPDILIELPVGPEVITGSTRMKSGTAQKMALNMISTTAMVLLGKTAGNLMIDLQARSEKLAARSRKILMDLFGLTLGEANDLLVQAAGSVKLAIVMQQLGCDRTTAEQKLAEADGFICRLKR
ncbi:N-acetylmuramic acid 6-phosphate etherase [candidate division GN15 bacterium]|nr:N-acetylmuramic acid 6-phosphate etherase [candidate division GN15 bacterium]